MGLVRFASGARGRGRWIAAVALALAALVAFANIGTSPAEAAGPSAPSLATPTGTPVPPPPACDITGWEKTPPGERNLSEARFVSCPTKDGLGECKQGIAAMTLNTRNASEELVAIKRNSDGGFTASLIFNCRVSAIKWEVVNNSGTFLVGATADVTDYDEVDYVYEKNKVYLHHPLDAPGVDNDGDGNCDAACPGTPMLNEYGQLIEDLEAAGAKEVVKGYLYRFGYKNGTKTEANTGKTTDILSRNVVYDLKYTIEPYPNAPDNYSISETKALLEFLSTGPIETIKRYINPEYWIQVGVERVMQGAGNMIMLGMCTVMSRFMTDEHIKDFDTFPETDSIGEYVYWSSDPTSADALHYDIFDSDGNMVSAGSPKLRWVEGHDNDNVNNSDMNCKRPKQKYGDQLRELSKVAYDMRNDISVAKGLPPMGDPHGGASIAYARDVIDGVDPRDRDDADWVDFVAYDARNITLFPRLALDPQARYSLQQGSLDSSVTGITTFTGLLVGTPPNLTYERGLVRIGWSLILNVMVAVMVVFIAWIGLNQVVKGFTGSRSQADWRELVPRFILAIIAAVTSYWWCSLLVDTADGISRYLAAGMRVTPADITGTLGQAVVALVSKQVTGYGASILIGAQFGLFVRSLGMTLLVSMMLIYCMIILLIIGQFIMRIVLINLLIMLSPLAMILWALPETAGWGKKWMGTFTMTLWQHGLQLVCFSMGLWFVKLGSPLNLVSGSGLGMENFLKKGPVGMALPTEMIWAFALGIMAMMMCYKLPGLMGNSIMESWTSTLSFAAMGARAVLSMAATSFGGPAGALLSGMGMKGLGSVVSNFGRGGAGLGSVGQILNPTGGGGGGSGPPPESGSVGLASAGADGNSGGGGNAFAPLGRIGMGAGYAGFQAARMMFTTGAPSADVAPSAGATSGGASDSAGSGPSTGGASEGVSRPQAADSGVSKESQTQQTSQRPFRNMEGANPASARTVSTRERDYRFARNVALDQDQGISEPSVAGEGYGREDIYGDEAIQPAEQNYLREHIGPEGIKEIRQDGFGDYKVGDDGELKWVPDEGPARPASEAQKAAADGLGVQRLSNLTNNTVSRDLARGAVQGAGFGAGASAAREIMRGGPGKGPQQAEASTVSAAAAQPKKSMWDRMRQRGANIKAGAVEGYGAGVSRYDKIEKDLSGDKAYLGEDGKVVGNPADIREMTTKQDAAYAAGDGDVEMNADKVLESKQFYNDKGDYVVNTQTGVASAVSGEEAVNYRKLNDAMGSHASREGLERGLQVLGPAPDGNGYIVSDPHTNAPRLSTAGENRAIDGWDEPAEGSVGRPAFDRIGGYGEQDEYLHKQDRVVGLMNENGEAHEFTPEERADHDFARSELGDEQYEHNLVNSVSFGGRASNGDFLVNDDSAPGGIREAKPEELALMRNVGPSGFDNMFKERQEEIRGYSLNLDNQGGYEDRIIGHRDMDGNLREISEGDRDSWDHAKSVLGEEQYQHNLNNAVTYAGKSDDGKLMINDDSVAGGKREATREEFMMLGHDGQRAEEFDAKFGERMSEVTGRVGVRDGEVSEDLSYEESLNLHRMEKGLGEAGLQAHIAGGVRHTGMKDGQGHELVRDGSVPGTQLRRANAEEMRLYQPDKRVEGLEVEGFNSLMSGNKEFRGGVHTVTRADGKNYVGDQVYQDLAHKWRADDTKDGKERIDAVYGEKIHRGEDPALAKPTMTGGRGRQAQGRVEPANPNQLDDRLARGHKFGLAGAGATAIGNLLNRDKEEQAADQPAQGSEGSRGSRPAQGQPGRRSTKE